MRDPAGSAPGVLQLRDLGRMAYDAALVVQQQVHQSVVEGRSEPTLLLVEHDPVITITRRPQARRHLLVDLPTLGAMGIAIAETDRGGDITYHGPGQLVAYPIVNLAQLGLNIGRYMRLLEQVAIETVAAFGITARRVDRCAGVWIDGQPQKKLCALGVRVRRNVTMHGMALNVEPDMSHFRVIVPCGLAEKSVTSLAQLLVETVPSMGAVKKELTRYARRHLLIDGNVGRADRLHESLPCPSPKLRGS